MAKLKLKQRPATPLNPNLEQSAMTEPTKSPELEQPQTPPAEAPTESQDVAVVADPEGGDKSPTEGEDLKDSEAPADDANAEKRDGGTVEGELPPNEPGAEDTQDEAIEDLNPPVITPASPTAPAPIAVAITPKPVVDEPFDLSTPEGFLGAIEADPVNYPKQAKLLEEFKSFAAVLRPRTEVSPADANRVQRSLLKRLLLILEDEPGEFRKLWSTALVYFHHHHGDKPTRADYTAISDYNTNRYLDKWDDGEEAQLYANLMQVLRLTRNPETRKATSAKIDLEKISPRLTGRAMENLTSFYR